MRILAAVVLMGVAGCTEGIGPLPPLKFPQIEQARQSVEGGIGKRYEDYAACRKTANDVDSLVACMKIAGYQYAEHSAEQQAAECWRLRDPKANPDGRLPDSWCFRHAPADAAQ